MPVQRPTSISANVHKKGRPRVFDSAPGFEREYRRQFEGDSYRAFYERLRTAGVRHALADVVGEDPIGSAGDGTTCRPLQAKRWPWLLGRKVQNTVLLQLHGLDKKTIAECCDGIEKLHAAGKLRNAKEAVEHARGIRIWIQKERHVSAPEVTA
jgi:hypothetical protein